MTKVKKHFIPKHDRSHPNIQRASRENGKLGGRPKKWDGESLDALADSLDEWIENAIQNKTEFWWWDWCQEVGVNQNRVAKLAESNERFRRSYENAKAWQESIVARFALTKKFSDNFSRFFLTSMYGDRWRDKSNDLSNSSNSNLAEILKLLSDKKISEEAFLKIVSTIPGAITQSNVASE